MSSRANGLSVRFFSVMVPIGPSIALVHVAWAIRGDHDLDGRPRQPRQGLFSWVMQQDVGGRWWIRLAHNTHVAAAA